MTRSFVTTQPQALDTGSFPMRLWAKARKLGVWDPTDIDFAQDASDWARLQPEERDILLRLSALFQAGEEAVVVDLLPLMQVISSEGRLDEELYLTSFLFEEAKHVECFRRFFTEVAGERSDLSRYFTPSYRRIFEDALPEALNRLRDDPAPEAQADAAVTYNLVVEGVLAETGYHAYHSVLTRRGIMPGMQEVTRLLKQDESRHLAYGVYLLSRLIVEHGAPIRRRIRSRLLSLGIPALGVVREAFAPYDPVPFGLSVREFTGYAWRQFRLRQARINRADADGLDQLPEDLEGADVPGFGRLPARGR